MALVGEQLDSGDEITGARVVDKSRNRNTIFRLELWYRDASKNEVNEAVRSKLLDCLKAASSRQLRFDSVPHAAKKW